MYFKSLCTETTDTLFQFALAVKFAEFGSVIDLVLQQFIRHFIILYCWHRTIFVMKLKLCNRNLHTMRLYKCVFGYVGCLEMLSYGYLSVCSI